MYLVFDCNKFSLKNKQKNVIYIYIKFSYFRCNLLTYVVAIIVRSV